MQKDWLVKIEGEIKGPFTLEELKNMVSQETLGPLDEVNKPMKSWVYANSVKELGFVSEKTETGDYTAPSVPELEEIESDDILISPEEDTRVQEIPYISIDKKEEPKQKPVDRFEGVQEAGTGLKMSHLFRTLWQFTIVVFITATVGVIWMNKQNTPPAEPINLENDLQAARDLFNTRKYQEAVDLYKEIIQKDESALVSRDWMNLSEFSIQKMNQIYEARRFLEKAQSFADFDSQRGHLINGVIHFADGNSFKAQDSFESMDKNARGTDVSLAYQFIIFLRQKNLTEAQNVLNQFSDESSIGSFLSFVGANLFSLEGVEQFDEPRYAQEISFVQMSQPKIESSQSNESSVGLPLSSSDIQKFLDQNPYLIEEFEADLLSPPKEMIWKNLFLETCFSRFKEMEETAYSLAFYAFCLAQSGLDTEPKEFIDKGLKLYPKDPLVLSIYAFIFNKDPERHQVYVDRALSVNENFELPFILKARSCHGNQDYKCAYENWKQVKGGETFYSKAGQAQALYFLNQSEEAFKIAEEGLDQMPSYLPFKQVLLLKN